jgi:hypothetical protein
MSSDLLCLRAAQLIQAKTERRGKNSSYNELKVLHNAHDHDSPPLACAQINDFDHKLLLELLAPPHQRGKHSDGNQRFCLIEPR